MAKKIHRAIYEGNIGTGPGAIPCAVLENGWRVLTLRGCMAALGYSSAPERLRKPVSGNSVLDYLPENVISSIDEGSSGVRKLVPFFPTDAQERGGSSALGVRAELFPLICEAILKARDAGKLRKDQENMGKQADALMRSFAKLGIIALVDEATGYQEVRGKHELEEILKGLLAEEMQPWVKRFPDEYYKEIARLHGWDGDILSGDKPGIVGTYTNDLVYARLAPGILEVLHERVPRNEKGKLDHKLHQELQEAGVRKLEIHLAKLVAYMQTSTSWRGFMLKVNKHLRRYRSPETGVLDLDDTEEEQSEGGAV